MQRDGKHVTDLPQVERSVGFREATRLDVDWPDDATRDRLVGPWWFYQRRGGHRTSTDDLVTAYSAAAHAARPVGRYCDIGCGIGSVLLTAAYALRPAECVGIEAQAQSARMAARSVAELPSGAPPIRVLHGDLRDATDDALGRFDVITGSPPYLPLGTGSLSPDPQRQACRFELRGGVEAYAAAAARLLSESGSFHLVFQSLWNARVEAALEAVGLRTFARTDFAMREGRAPFLSVFAARREAEAPRADVQLIAVRDAEGERTEAYQRVRTFLGHEDPPPKRAPRS